MTGVLAVREHATCRVGIAVDFKVSVHRGGISGQINSFPLQADTYRNLDYYALNTAFDRQRMGHAVIAELSPVCVLCAASILVIKWWSVDLGVNCTENDTILAVGIEQYLNLLPHVREPVIFIVLGIALQHVEPVGAQVIALRQAHAGLNLVGIDGADRTDLTGDKRHYLSPFITVDVVPSYL